MVDKKMENEERNDVKKKRTKAMNLYLFLFLLVYSYLQIGFSGLYTYTTISVLITCLMYFSIFTLYTGICMFIKFRKKEYSKEEIDKVLKKTLIGVIVIILLYSVCYIYNYINNMNGILKAKETYSIHTQKINDTSNNVIEQNIVSNSTESVENIVEASSEIDQDKLTIMQDMLAYNSAMNELDTLYNGMKEKMFIYIGLRVLTDIIDIVISSFVILVLSKMMIYKIAIIKEEK